MIFEDNHTGKDKVFEISVSIKINMNIVFFFYKSKKIYIYDSVKYVIFMSVTVKIGKGY